MWLCAATSDHAVTSGHGRVLEGPRYASDVTLMAERIRLLTEMAERMLAAGADTDQVAIELLRRSGSPVSAIKALRDATGMGLGDAKWVVHRNLAPQTREAAEGLWDDLLDGLAQLREAPTQRAEPGPQHSVKDE